MNEQGDVFDYVPVEQISDDDVKRLDKEGDALVVEAERRWRRLGGTD